MSARWLSDGKYEIRAKKARKSVRNRKNLMKMRCCGIHGGQTDTGSSQKHFLPFNVLLNVGIDPNFPQKKLFSFLALFKEKFRFIPAKKVLV